MWNDDKYWLPKVLEGRRIKATFYFNESKKVKSHTEFIDL